MAGNYWSGTLRRRVTRRRVVAGSGAGALSAAFLAACGADDDGGSGSTGSATGPTGTTGSGSSGLVTTPEDTTPQAQRGGTLKFSVTADIPNLDPHYLSLANAQQVLLNYNRLTRVQPGHLDQSDGTIIGDAVESWEFSPDKTTVTMKVRNNLGTPDVAPVNGRNLDAQDILYSWQRFRQVGNNRMDYANDINPNAPVLSLDAPDSHTLVVKLNQPVSSIMSLFSSQASGQFFIFPMEAESEVDIRHNPIGAGVYYMGEYRPSERFVYRRNPHYFDDRVAWADTIDVPIIGEQAVGATQLRSGGLHSYTVSAEEVLQTKKDVPDINLYQSDYATIGVCVFFGFKADPAADTPFRDVRVRQAYSMGIDRDLLIDTYGNVSKFESAGVPVDTAWSTNGLWAGVYKGWWMDPRDDAFGENKKYFEHNVEEAKKLLASAGYGDGLDVISNQINTPDYGPNYLTQVEVLDGMTSEVGFRFTKAIQDYKTNWATEFRDSHGYFDGMAYRLIPGASDPGDTLYMYFNKGGSVYYGFNPDGKGLASKDASSFLGDPICDDLTNRMRLEFDDAERKRLAIELQRYIGKTQYMVYPVGAATGFQLAWPAVRNWRVNRTLDWGQLWASYWVDPTQPPRA
jgi:peptide/nickel transport system substrate-binding protein